MQLDRHSFGFPMKNLTIFDQSFQRFHRQKKDIGSCVVFSSTAPLQISFVDIILRHHLEISVIENRFSCHFQFSEAVYNIYYSNQL